jgi:hypothetical protein
MGAQQRQNSHQRFKFKSYHLAVIAAISEEHGLIDYIVHPKAINSEVFVAFINQIAEKLGGGDFALFLDNLSVHKTKDAKHLFEKLNITEIFNVDTIGLIKQSIKSVSNENATRCVRYALA